MLEKNFYNKVEEKGYLDRVLYSDTDSLYINIPNKITPTQTIEDRWEIASHVAENINNLIIDYTKDVLLPRCNIKPVHNKTFFKTELLMSSAMFLDVKKSYAFKLINKEGKVLSTPKVQYVGIQVIKTNTPKITQQLLIEFIEGVMLNEDIPNDEKKTHLSGIIEKYYNIYIDNVKNFNFQDIGVPGKWAKTKLMINGMKLYNKLLNEQVFSPGSSGRFIYCKLDKSYGKTKGICVPYEYDSNILKEKLDAYNIKIDVKTQWDKLITTTVKRVINLSRIL